MREQRVVPQSGAPQRAAQPAGNGASHRAPDGEPGAEVRTGPLVGLTGGIGSGKSTVARTLAVLGALVVDADAIAREVVAVGTPGLAQVVDVFGDSVLSDNGELDRAELGRRVFSDPQARKRLEAITHPLIQAETLRRFASANAGQVVVHDIPLLVELGKASDYDLVIVVDAPVATRISRLVNDRAMAREEAEKRIAAQATPEQRRAVADVWLDNSSTPDDLITKVRAMWRERIEPLRHTRSR